MNLIYDTLVRYNPQTAKFEMKTAESLTPNADFTVFREIPKTRAISEIGNSSDRRNRRICAQSSTLNTRFLLGP